MDEEYEEVCELLQLCFRRFKGIMRDQIGSELQRLQQGQIQSKVESSGYKIQNARDSGWHRLGMYDPSIPEAIKFWFLDEDEEESLENQEQVNVIELSGFEEQGSYVAAFEELDTPLSSSDHSEETNVPCKDEDATNGHSHLSIEDVQVDKSLTDCHLMMKIGTHMEQAVILQLPKFRDVLTSNDKVMTFQVSTSNVKKTKLGHLDKFWRMAENKRLAGQPEQGHDRRSFIFDRGKFRMQDMHKVGSCVKLNQVFKVLPKQQDSQGCSKSVSALLVLKSGMEVGETTIQQPEKFRSISIETAEDIPFSKFDINFGIATSTTSEGNSQQLIRMPHLKLKLGRTVDNTGIQHPTKFQGVSVEDEKVILVSHSVKLSVLRKKEQVLDMVMLNGAGSSEHSIQAMGGYFGRVRPPEAALEPDNAHIFGMYFHFVRPPDFSCCSIILGHLRKFFHIVRPPESRFELSGY